MPNRLHRYYGAGYLHFITTSYYQRRALLDSRKNRDLFLKVLEQVRRRYRFVVVGYVVMPEHVHLLFGEPERGNPSVVMQGGWPSFAFRRVDDHNVRLPHPCAFCKGGHHESVLLGILEVQMVSTKECFDT
jgi:REP element-mobilizing transposase RayT